MRPAALGSRRVSPGARVVALAVLLTAATILPAGALAFGSPAPPATNLFDSSLRLPPSGFAERAGYSPVDVSESPGAVPATGTQQLEVTFAPSSSTFYDAPSSDAAPMTVSQIADTYGLSVPAYTSAEQYFESEGLAVTHTWPDRLSLSLAGTAEAVDRAFGTSLVSGSYDGSAVTFPASAPALPPNLETEVAAVAGLSDGFDRFSLPVLPALPAAAVGPAQNPNDLITPAIARDIYDVSGLYNLSASPTYATGKGIVLLLWGLGYAPDDLSTFFGQDYPSGFPAPTIKPYPVDGAPTPSANAVNDPSNGSRELTLDIEWSGSMAPGATLDAVYAPDGPASQMYSPNPSNMVDALNLAVDPSSVPNVAAISMSFGSEDGGDPGLTSGFETDFTVAAHEKISVFAATGDTGGDASSSCTGGPQPEYPAASPQVVAVGGTAVSLQRSVLGAITGFSESAWSQSGGGFSTEFSAPSWQEVGSAKAPIEANGHRGMPDVAATAGYNFLYFDGQDAAAGGTSFATPLWAGMVTEMDALRGTNFGFLTPAIYELGANTTAKDYPFNDITTGSNCLGPAGTGWDTATGWGSPVAVYLYEHFVSSFVNITLVATPSPVAPGGTVSVTVTITNATSGAPVVGVPVGVSLSSAGIGGPCSGSFGTVSPVTNGTGAVAATITVPYCYLGSSAVATAAVMSGGYYGNSSTSVSVNLLGFDPALAPLTHYPDNVVLYVVVMALSILAGGVLGRRRGDQGPSSAAPSSSPQALPPAPAPPATPSPDPPTVPTSGPVSAPGEPSPPAPSA